MYSMDYEIHYNDYKDYERVKPIAAMELIQEIAVRDSDAMGFGVDVLRKKGLAWLLKGFNVHFEHQLSTHAPLSGFTGVQKNKASTSERGSIIRQNGEIAVKSIAEWFMFDANAGRPCRILPEMLEAYELYDFQDDFFKFKKPRSVSDASLKYEITVSNKDIDTNRHINNLKSAEILMDTLPFDFFFHDMSIIYKKQAYLGDVLGVCSAEFDGGYYASLVDKDGKVCVEANFSA